MDQELLKHISETLSLLVYKKKDDNNPTVFPDFIFNFKENRQTEPKDVQISFSQKISHRVYNQPLKEVKNPLLVLQKTNSQKSAVLKPPTPTQNSKSLSQKIVKYSISDDLHQKKLPIIIKTQTKDQVLKKKEAQKQQDMSEIQKYIEMITKAKQYPPIHVIPFSEFIQNNIPDCMIIKVLFNLQETLQFTKIFGNNMGLVGYPIPENINFQSPDNWSWIFMRKQTTFSFCTILQNMRKVIKESSFLSNFDVDLINYNAALLRRYPNLRDKIEPDTVALQLGQMLISLEQNKITDIRNEVKSILSKMA